jgi:tetratricopeptide (TPR) repeat protein
MGLFGKPGKGSGKDNPRTQNPGGKDPDMIRAFDKYGREVLIPRSEWQSKVLPENIKQNWNDPQGLYLIVIQSIDDGFVKDVLPASKRLLSIDPQKERAYCARGIALMKSGDLGGAETTLNEYLEKYGPSGYVITNLAKVFADRGDQRKSELALWRALTLDPNQDNALSWWEAIFRERGGEQGAIDALKKAAALPKSWRPQLILGLRSLQQKDLPGSLTYLNPLLENQSDQPDVLQFISGELGRNGYAQEVIDLVGPRFAPDKHSPGAGINLLEACRQTGNHWEGEEVLHRLNLLNRPDLKSHLDYYAEQFAELKKKSDRMPTATSPSQAIDMVNIVRPIWYYGLEDPVWMFPQAADNKPAILFLALSASKGTSAGEGDASFQHEDDLGRLSRSIPLYMAEGVFLQSMIPCQVFFPMVKGKGMVLFGSELAPEQIWKLANDRKQDNPRLIVSGVVEPLGENFKVTLKVWDCYKKLMVKEMKQSAPMQGIEYAFLKMEQEFLSLIGVNLGRPFGFPRIASNLVPYYLSGLAQSLTMTFAASGWVPKESLFGERNMLNWFLKLAMEEKKSQVPKIMFLSGLAKARKYQSEAYLEFKGQALSLLEDESDAASPFFKLSPLLFKIFDMNKEFGERKSLLLPSADFAYAKWLGAL